MDSYPINYKDPPTCDDYPIKLGKDVDPANRHPGVGYWLNDPFGGHYFPFSIPNDEDPGALKGLGLAMSVSQTTKNPSLERWARVTLSTGSPYT